VCARRHRFLSLLVMETLTIEMQSCDVHVRRLCLLSLLTMELATVEIRPKHRHGGIPFRDDHTTICRGVCPKRLHLLIMATARTETTWILLGLTHITILTINKFKGDLTMFSLHLVLHPYRLRPLIPEPMVLPLHRTRDSQCPRNEKLV
jgi:hypothetical protein